MDFFFESFRFVSFVLFCGNSHVEMNPSLCSIPACAGMTETGELRDQSRNKQWHSSATESNLTYCVDFGQALP